MKLFISYARLDGSDAAQRLRDDLTASGHDIWQDVDDMRGGQGWQAQLGAALREVDAVLVLLTPGAAASEYVKWEWQTALYALNKPVFPLLILPCDVPDELARLHYNDLSNPDHYIIVLLKLLRDLRELEGKIMSEQAQPPQASGSKYNLQNNQIEKSTIGDHGTTINVSGSISGKNVILGQQTINGDLRIDSDNYQITYNDTAHLRDIIQQLFDASHQKLIANILTHLDEQNLVAVHKILAAIDANRLSDMEINMIVAEARSSLANIELEEPTLQELLSPFQEGKPEVEARELLRLTIPIIPFVLTYEHELEFGKRTSIQRLWQFLIGT